MIVINRQEDDSIRIGRNITVRVMRSADGVVRLGVEAPPGVPVVRAELAAARDSKPSSGMEPLRDKT
jgi:carbon storage regulator CsrA